MMQDEVSPIIKPLREDNRKRLNVSMQLVSGPELVLYFGKNVCVTFNLLEVIWI